MTDKWIVSTDQLQGLDKLNYGNDGGKSTGGRNADEPPKSDVDGPWSWVVLACTLVAAIVGTGQVQSVNIYFVIFVKEFQQSSSFTAWISAAQNTALCISGPVCSFVLQRFGARVTMFVGSMTMATCLFLASFANSVPYLIVVYAFIGASQCFFTGACLASVSMYFQKRASLVTGIMLAGGGIGGMVTGLELEWAVETFGWRGAMFVQSGIVLQVCVCASLVFRIRPEKTKRKSNGVAVVGASSKANGAAAAAATTNENGNRGQSVAGKEPSKTSLKTLVPDALFWLSVLSYLSLQANNATMITIFKGFVVSAGLETSFKMALTTMGVGNMVGRLLSGVISQLLCSPLHMAVMAVTCGITNALFIQANVPWVLAVVGAAFGFCQGQMMATWLLSISWVFGPKEMPVIRGHTMFFGIISSMSFPPIAGYTVDLTGNYNIALMMSAASSLCCGICGLVTYLIHRGRRLGAKHSYDLTGLRTKSVLVTNNNCHVKIEHYAPSIAA